MDKAVLSKIIDPVIKPFLPAPGEGSGIGGLFSGGNLMAAMDMLKTLQQMINQGTLAAYLVEHVEDSVLADIDEVLSEAGYKKG